jgi:hypothetical protein
MLISHGLRATSHVKGQGQRQRRAMKAKVQPSWSRDAKRIDPSQSLVWFALGTSSFALKR